MFNTEKLESEYIEDHLEIIKKIYDENESVIGCIDYVKDIGII